MTHHTPRLRLRPLAAGSALAIGPATGAVTAAETHRNDPAVKRAFPGGVGTD